MQAAVVIEDGDGVPNQSASASVKQRWDGQNNEIRQAWGGGAAGGRMTLQMP